MLQRSLFSLIALVVMSRSTWPQDERPNVVLIFTDDQGMHDVGCYGSEISTPHIDALARAGLKFTSWYSASAICTPSRFGLLTGQNPCRSRDRLLSALMFLGEHDQDRGIRPGETTLASVLADAGYRTALVGKWHLGHGSRDFWPTRHGFDSFFGHTGGCVDFFTMRYGNHPDWYRDETALDVGGYATDILTAEAVRFLGHQESGSPFFLLLSYNAPHFGKGWNDGEKKTVNQLQPHPQYLRRVAAIDDITRRKYAAKVVNLDDGVGQVLQALEDRQLADQTLVIFLTDHGGDPVYGGSNTPFRGGKATLFEGGIRVPCLMRWPERIRAGRETDAAVSSLDIFPTLCQLADADRGDVDGQDITALLDGAADATNATDAEGVEPRQLYWELAPHGELDRGRWIAWRQGRWKYVADSQGQEYVFDLDADPGEQQNLAGVEPDMLLQLRAQCTARSQELSGELPIAK